MSGQNSDRCRAGISRHAGPPFHSCRTAIANTSRRGYSEHEHLDNLLLIHMNGRVQDPVIGRFLSADPFVSQPFNGQSFNRYSYVRNNPLTLIDPTGFVATALGPEDGCGSVICVGPAGPGGYGWGGLGWGGNVSGYGQGLLSFSFNYLAVPDFGRNPDSIASDPDVEHYDQQVAQVKRSESCGQEYCQPSLLADSQFYQDLAVNTYREFITEPVKATMATAAAVATGDPAAIASATANTACEVSKICDGLKSWVKNIKRIRELVRDAAKSVPKAGRYEFPDQAADGKLYVGQSGNIPKRLEQHERAGRYSPDTATTTAVPGGKTAREISEHQRIQEITGGVPARHSGAVSNQLDPIGPKRRHLLPGE